MADGRRHRIHVPQSGHRGGNLASPGEGDDGPGGRRPIAVVVPEPSGTQLRWKCAAFDELTPREVHDLFQARVGVFVLEQKCPFQDVDGVDPHCWHLMGFSPAPSPEGRGEGQGSLLAYARLVPPGVKYPEPSIGRVLTTAEGRGTGAGRALMAEAVRRATAMWPGRALRIGAQAYLERFYGDYGFVKASEPYDEDGIPHIEMVRRA